MEGKVWILCLSLFLGDAVWLAECLSPRMVMKTDVTTVLAPDASHYRGITFDLADRQWFPFSARACHDVHLYFSYHWTQFHNGSEVLIGGWRNTRSVIVALPARDDSIFLDDVQTPDILDCLEFRKFWVSWNNNTILVGRGNVYGKQIFMQSNRLLRPELNHQINQVNVASGFGATGTYRINENIAERLNVQTTNEYGYRFVWKTVRYHNQFVTFEVKACSAAHVALTQYQGSIENEGYEVVISGWGGRKSAIRRTRMKENKNETYSENLLTCGSFRPFWISWHDETIRLGTGYMYGNNEVVSWRDDYFRYIRAVSFSTGFGEPGTWNFFENLEPVYFIKSKDVDSSTTDWITVPRQRSIRFHVRSAKDVHVLLSPTDGPSDLAIELVIGQGDGDSQVSFFRKFGSNENIKQAPTPNVLDINLYLKFWVSWEDNKLRFGRDHMVGIYTLLEADMDSFEVRTVNFNAHTPSWWKIAQREGEQMVLSTQNNIGQRDTWLTTHQEYYKSFSLQGSNTAYVMLTRDSGAVTVNSYMVAIGENGNQEVNIKQGVWAQPMTSVPKASALLPDVLSPTSFRTFWIGWLNNTLSVGRGWRFGQNLIAYVPELIPHPVEALNIASGSKLGQQQDRTSWKFESDLGDRLMVNTSGNAVDFHWNRLRKGRTWVAFSVMACDTTVHVALGDTYDGNPKNLYRIVIMGMKDDINIAYITKNTEKQGEVNASGLLTCDDPRDFWLSWADGKIQFGRGRNPGFKVVTSWKDPKPTPVVAVGLSHGQGNAEWRYSVEEYLETSHVVQPDRLFTQTWLTSRHRQSVLLGIQACGAFSVLLGPILGLTVEDYTYSINLNMEGGKTHTIQSGINGLPLASITTKEEVLVCGKEVFIWIQYIQGSIMVGQGIETEKNVLLNLGDVTDADVKAIGVTAGDGVHAQVRISHNLDGDPFTQVRPNRKPSGLSGGAIAGIVIAVLLVLIIIGTVVLFMVRGVPDPVKNTVNNIQSKLSKSGQDQSQLSQSFDNPLAGSKA